MKHGLVAFSLCGLMSTALAAPAGYLDGMPQPDRVRSAIQGADAADSAARQYAAFVILVRTLEELSDGRVMRRVPTPGEAALRQSCVQATRDVQRELEAGCQSASCAKDSFNRLALRYSMNEPFRKEVFERLTERAWRERYVKDWHALVAQHGSGATTAPKLEPKLELPAHTPPPTAAEVAANPRLSVFGLGLDQEFTLPRCSAANANVQSPEQLAALFKQQGDRFCWRPSHDVLNALYGTEAGSIAINLPQDRCPTWAFCELYAKVTMGRLRSVTVNVRDAGAAREVLSAKYGKPTANTPMRLYNRAGMNVEYTDLEWSLQDVYVHFTPMTNANGLGRIVVKGPSQTRRERREGDQRRANEVRF